MEELKSTYPLIHNKVTSPRFVTPILRRGRLLDWLNAHAEARAIVIAAGAGYGKTTLLWQWEREATFPCFWYKLDRNDRDWTLHISYLVEAISQQHPGFGRRAHSMLRQMGGPGSSRPGVAAFLLAEMHEKIREPTTFIIDDWQYVASVTEVRGLWNQILRDAPPTCRFVFASRGKPQLQFARFKTHGGYAELRTDDLRVTEKELTELFRDIYHNPLTIDEVSELERRTEGWAVGLQLVQVSMRDRKTPEDRHALITSLATDSESDLFSFLAEEVLDQQTEETRNFLTSTSILQQITPDVAERLAGVHDGSRHLLQLELSGLFTYRLDESRFRYHGLFREFLENRLSAERSGIEIIGLHIHAASYFETSEQWPQAIYHYLRAGLQRQAARLIARFGEDVVREGRLALVDDWLRRLPAKAVHDNARLSLLQGEALGIAGNWDAALAALRRGLAFFEQKRDARMQALALIKMGTLFSHWGDPTRGADAAARALETAPLEARDLRLRAEGDLILTRTWLEMPLSKAQDGMQRLTTEAESLGLEHYAALGSHNLGQIQLEMGAIERGLKSLERAAAFWNQPDRSPFADNYNLVLALLILGQLQRAEDLARRGMAATRGWPRIEAEAAAGLSEVLLARGRFTEAKECLEPFVSSAIDLGASSEIVLAHFLAAKVLASEVDDEAARVLDQLRTRALDPRLAPGTQPVIASVEHAAGICLSRCGVDAMETAQSWAARGGAFIGADAVIRVGPALLDHDNRIAPSAIVKAIDTLSEIGALRYERYWLRRLVPHTDKLIKDMNPRAFTELIAADAGVWGPIAIRAIPGVRGENRTRLIEAVDKYSEPVFLPALRGAGASSDVAALREKLVTRHAPRLFVGTFGKLLVHRGSWGGPIVDLPKKRERLLLSFLIAHAGVALSRDQVLDALWPDAGASAAVNSLNQTVFQLRRRFDPQYRDGSSPQYIVSTMERVGLNADLVRVDWQEVERRVSNPSSSIGNATLEFLLSCLRGQFLQESLYEDWADGPRQQMHQRIRTMLLPAVRDESIDSDTRARLGRCLVIFDEYDEAAHIALAGALNASGRKVAAVTVLRDLRTRIERDFSDMAHPDLDAAIHILQAADGAVDRVT